MKSVLLYLVLVGLPVLGILGLLRVGQTLSAPISLAGTWTAQLSLPDLDSSTGGPGRHPSQPMVLTITQSGSHVVLMFDDDQRTTLVGKIQGATIDAATLAHHGGTAAIYASDFGSIPRSFRASIDRQAEPHRLVGVLVMDRGRLHTEVPIVAVQKEEGVRKGVGFR
jgi:hypothetical protein